MRSTKDVKVDTPQKKQPLKYFLTKNLPRPPLVKQADRKGSKIVVTTRDLEKFRRAQEAAKDREKRALAKKQKAAALAKANKKKPAAKKGPKKPARKRGSTAGIRSKTLTK